MTTFVARRIEERMRALGKNPSSLALEAGLSRSSVRDILVGKAESPRLSTLAKLAGPLECSIDYLTGHAETPVGEAINRYVDFDARPGEISQVLQAGVYREPKRFDPTDWLNRQLPGTFEKHLLYSDLRMKDAAFALYLVSDSSMNDVGIYDGDVITGAGDLFDQDQFVLREGMIVVVRHTSGNPTLEEHSLREVTIGPKATVLITRNSEKHFRPITLDAAIEQRGLQNAYHTQDGGIAIIMAIAVRVTRSLPVV